MSDEEVRKLIQEELGRKRRIFQDDIMTGVVKNRHIDGVIIKFGLAADRPTDGGAVGVKSYFATDTNVLSLWNGTAWVSETLT